MSFSRRSFLATSLLGSLSFGLDRKEQAGSAQSAPSTNSAATKRPIIISAANGFPYIEDGYSLLKSGGDTLDAALRVVRGPEDDPKDTSVGLGGLPNEEGVVELDACCMHGPSRRAGSV